MPALMGDSAGVKWVNSHPENPMKHKLPTVMGLYVLSDPDSALPLAVMDATLLTALRTGLLLRSRVDGCLVPSPTSQRLVLLGAVYKHIMFWKRIAFSGPTFVVLSTMSTATEVWRSPRPTVRCSPRPAQPARRISFALSRQSGSRWSSRFGFDLAHINALGADAEGKQEIESTVLSRARVFVDDREQAAHSGRSMSLFTSMRGL